MPKKRAFVDKKNAAHFMLMPTNVVESQMNDCAPSTNTADPKALESYGIYRNDGYDYSQHLRSIKEEMTLVPLSSARRMATLPTKQIQLSCPPPMLFSNLAEGRLVSKGYPLDNENLGEDAEGLFDVSDDEDAEFCVQNLIASGVVDESVTKYRDPSAIDSSQEDSDDDDYMPEYDFDRDDDEEDKTVHRDPALQRDIDDGFDKFLDAAYDPEEIGGLEHDDPRLRGVIDPNNPRIINMLSKKKDDPDYDPEFAKAYIRKRMRVWAKDEEEQSEVIEVDEGASKRLKWDCESFASQYSNIYNRPTAIKELSTKLSKKALRRLDRLAEKEEEPMEDEDVEMDDGESMISTVSTFRPKGETAEERRLRKAAVKEVQRARRAEKKINKVAFAEEARKLKQQSLAVVKGRQLK